MNVLFAILPVVLIAVIGFLARRFNLIGEKYTGLVETLVFYVLMPCLLFRGMARMEFPAQMDWHYLLGFYGSVVVMFGVGMAVARFGFGSSLRQQSVYGMGCAYSNVTLLGIPVTLQVLGEAAFLPMFLIISIHNLFQFTLGTVVAEASQDGESGLASKLAQAGFGLVRNPIIVSLLAGLIYNLLDAPRFDWLFYILDQVGSLAGPLALFIVGCSLNRYHIRGELGPALIMVGLKLLGFPLLVGLVMFVVLDVEPLWAATAVVLASMPVGISVYVFARQYRSCETQAAAGILVSSALCTLTLPVVAFLLELVRV